VTQLAIKNKMSLTRYDGVCFRCGKQVKAGNGDFQSIGTLPKDLKKNYTGANYKGKWLVRCFGCKNMGNKVLPSKDIIN